MNIEIQTGAKKTEEWILDFLKTKLIGLYNSDNDIHQAKVCLLEDEDSGNKICEIELYLNSDTIFVRQEAGSFAEACRLAVEAMTPLVNENIKERNQPPDEIISTVDV